ncbi:MAG: glycoside hydrolase N-terminal domain-containing protein [Sedimentisphaerales bacterium]|nr:glycoside hydrolase N-terminal domain-containing protein [Sedimentisphaerales bacterium]
MKRRNFLKTSIFAAGIAGSPELLEPLKASENSPQKPLRTSGQTSASAGTTQADNRPAEYLHRVQGDPFLPKPPTPARSYPISPMSLEERRKRKIVPQRGFCSITPGSLVSESLTSGNGAMNFELMGDPYSEQILFHHENLLMPWKRPLDAPQIADIFPQVRQMMLEGRHREAMTLALQHMNEGPIKQDTEPHRTIPAFLMQLDFPKTTSVRNYLRTVNFETSEVKVYWSDEHGDWLRQNITSRPDNVIVQWLTAPAGQSVNVRISLQMSAQWSMSSGMTGNSHPAKGASKGPEAGDVQHDFNAQRLIYKYRLDPSVDNSGYAGVTRVVRNGGLAKMDKDALVIENATSVMLLTRIEYFPDFSEDKVEALQQAVEQITPDYATLLERHRKVQSEMLNRVTVDFGGASQYGMSAEELLADQRSRLDYSPALLEKVFEMGRHWFILTSGKYPGIAGESSYTVNLQTPGAEPDYQRLGEEVRPAGFGLLQTAGAVQGDLREGTEAYFNWIESLAPDCRANAKNIFGFRGTSYPLWPQRGMGVKYYYSNSSVIGGLWPYWISAGGLAYRPFWDHYLATGDQEFLRNRVLPGLKELAMFYEDFLTLTDKNGNYMFVPSFSPENLPTSTDPSGPVLANANMDITVCREVLANLIQACEILGTDTDSVPKWKAMLAKMPPYLLEKDGTLKEWAWPTLQEHYSHRHLSHLYGAWPGDEIDPDRTPQLARAAVIADRRHTFDTMSTSVSGEALPAYTRCHRALAGARLKDNGIVDVQLRQLMEQGYVSTALRCSREPYGAPVPDAQGGIPTIMMEMLAYSRPGVIEVLPALPASLVKGSISGMLARTFARIDKLTWDMQARTVDITITSVKKQDVTLIARYGIEAITAPDGVLAAKPKPGTANCDLHLPEGKPVEIHLKLGRHTPLDWVARIA